MKLATYYMVKFVVVTVLMVLLLFATLLDMITGACDGIGRAASELSDTLSAIAKGTRKWAHGEET